MAVLEGSKFRSYKANNDVYNFLLAKSPDAPRIIIASFGLQVKSREVLLLLVLVLMLVLLLMLSSVEIAFMVKNVR